MKWRDVKTVQWQPTIGRRTWLGLACVAALGGIASGAEFDPAEMQDPPPRGPAEVELERAKAAVRSVTSAPLATVHSVHYQGVGDAPEEFMKQVLLECESVAPDFLKHYRSRGFEVQPPEQRLTLLIFRDEKPFLKLLRGAPENVVGAYSSQNNFLMFYHRHSAGGQGHRAGRRNMITLSHEATHQLTFNTGLLNRKGDVPLCIAEGLAVYGEIRNGPGRNEPGRIIYSRLDDLAILNRGRKWLGVTELLTNDTKRIYSENWLLVHVFMTNADRLPQFRAYLKAIYPRTDKTHRLDDARAHLGDLDLLDRDLHNYAIRLQRSR